MAVFRTVLAAVLALGCSVSGARASPVAEYRDDRLTLRADSAPVAEVLAEVGRATGAEIRGVPPARDVTVDVAGVPLGDALARLLGSDSFALRYGPDGRLRAIEVLGRGAAAAWPPVAGAPPPDVPLGDPDRQHAVMTRSIDVTGRLAAALHTRRPTAGQLIQAAFRQKSAKVRAEAQARVLRAFAADPELEATFAASLAPIEDANLARILRGMAGDHAEEFMLKLAADAHSPELRTKAGAVVGALRDAPSARR